MLNLMDMIVLLKHQQKMERIFNMFFFFFLFVFFGLFYAKLFELIATKIY